MAIFLFFLKNGLQLILARLPTDIIDYPVASLTLLVSNVIPGLYLDLCFYNIFIINFANFTLYVLFAFAALTIFTAV